MSVKANGKLKRALGGKKGEAVMSAIPDSSARPGAWKTMLLPSPSENKHRTIPVAVDDVVVQEIANGAKASEIEEKYSLHSGTVRSVLIRRFGSIEGMKKALKAQCLENAIVLNDYAIQRIEQIPPGQALVGAKIMIDGAIALEKSSIDRPSTVDFAALSALGSVLERVEKIVVGSDRTVAATT